MDYDQIGVNLIISDDHYDISADSKHDKVLWDSETMVKWQNQLQK